MSESGICIIVLAAGESSRMGASLKQLLRFEGETLLRRATRAALGTHVRAVVVVLGFRADEMLEEIDASGALAVINQSWREGMGSSIRCGLARALEATAPDPLDAAILMLCDQPFVTGDVLMRLIDAYQTKRARVVASLYGTGDDLSPGVPALFDRALFPELLALRGAEGAKRIIERHKAEAESVGVPEAAFDVDTPGDYRALTERE